MMLPNDVTQCNCLASICIRCYSRVEQAINVVHEKPQIMYTRPVYPLS